MAGPLDAAAEVSLGQLAVAHGVISAAQRDQLGVDLLRRATAKRPTSMARLLVQGGLTAPAVQAILARGAGARAVRCDACELAIPQATLARRQEHPCPRCGCLVLGFAAYAGGPLHQSQPAPSAPPRQEPALPPDDTERWQGVLPLPGAEARVSASTDRWPGVLPLPTASPPPADVERTMAFGEVFLLPGGGAPRSEDEVADEMHTLLAPQGFAALAAAEGDPGAGPGSGSDLLPGFDPGAVTAPMNRDEIAATLRKGPPPSRPPASSAASASPAASTTPQEAPPALPTPLAELTITPGYALPPLESAPAPATAPAPVARPTARRRREPAARSRWPWVVAALLVAGLLVVLGLWGLGRLA
ncbi:MAG: hypothetical protein KF878_16285 [Planctomycetes bacterium]|nr:hypothetical protein [Planctomycetota bacterium]